MNEGIAHIQTGWTEQGDDPSMRFVPPLRGQKTQGTPWLADGTKPGSEPSLTWVHWHLWCYRQSTPQPFLPLSAPPSQAITTEEAHANMITVTRPSSWQSHSELTDGFKTLLEKEAETWRD